MIGIIFRFPGWGACKSVEAALNEKHYNFGHFVWRELLTPEVEAVKAFYGALCGWTFGQMEMPGGSTYTVIEMAGKPIGGVMNPPMQGIPPHWMSYVSVPDVDAAVEAVKGHGGGVMAGPMDISVGRLAVVTDPHGAALTVWKGAEGDGGPPGMPAAGEFCWETLVTPDADASKAFYTSTLGWQAGPGPGGPEMPVFLAGGMAIADIQPSRDMPPHWATYIVVPDAAAARERVAALGGKVIVPLIEVPTVGNIVLIQDPGGAFIGLFEPQMADA